jgi:nucleotide-binding universal stress UspA family protein
MIIGIGHVVDEILKVAKKDKYDLIVMGSKGRSLMGDLLVGSVAQRVQHGASAPVLLVK